MTRCSSLRAQAREIYRDLAANRVAEAPADKLGPGSPRARGRTGGSLSAQSLTKKARALYEHSAVPVAEIARLVGVTERTLYKYAQKGRWKPRYAWVDAGGAERRRGRKRIEGAGEDFAPAKGAGARFIRRADRDRPFARGLKAADPEGAARAAAACRRATGLSRKAQLQATLDSLAEDSLRAWAATNGALDKLSEYHEEHNKTHPRQPPPADDPILKGLNATLAGCLDWVEAVRAERERLARGRENS